MHATAERSESATPPRVTASGSNAPTKALIVGGGIAGLACALRLAQRGVAVTLLETRKKLGGRATSFEDVRTGQVLDNCQHVVLGCCTNYLDLLERLGVRDKVQWYQSQYWIEVGGRISVVERGSLPSPAHFALSMLRAPMFTTLDTLSLARACSKIMRVDRTRWKDQTFLSFLRGVGQSDRLIARFWAPVIISACNLPCDRVAASVALHVFQEGFLATKTAADIGVPSVPLVELYERAESLIATVGGRVLFGAGVRELDAHSATTTEGERFESERVVCAVPVERVRRVVTPACLESDERFRHLDEFTHSPILGVHMQFDRNVIGDLPHAVLVDRPTQWLFRKNVEGTSVHAVISSADDWISLNENDIGQRVLDDMRACLPAFQRGAGPMPALTSVRAVKEKLATFAPTPGVERFRPHAAGSSGIILAGDYTDTGWPATMEGATRSGYRAAACVLGCHESHVVIPSQDVAILPRLFGLRHPALKSPTGV